jgi:hypothetical protein
VRARPASAVVASKEVVAVAEVMEVVPRASVLAAAMVVPGAAAEHRRGYRGGPRSFRWSEPRTLFRAGRVTDRSGGFETRDRARAGCASVVLLLEEVVSIELVASGAR